MAKLLWTQRQDIGPAGRAGSAMAFDPVRGKIVLFGGTIPDRGTWEWDGQYWTQVSDMGPALRRESSMAWDGASKRGVVWRERFGGRRPSRYVGNYRPLRLPDAVGGRVYMRTSPMIPRTA